MLIVVVGLLEALPLFHALNILSYFAVNESAQNLCIFPEHLSIALQVLLGYVAELSSCRLPAVAIGPAL